MKNKIFLTSIFAIAFACPALADIYDGDTCDESVLGIYSGTADIEAIWELDTKDCLAGTYYNASTNTCETCTAGSWCVSGTYDVEHNQTGDGMTSCSTLSNGDYPLSASGSTANTSCYRNCANADVDHATQVSGAYYYGDNNQCSATQCAAGWHVKRDNIDISNINIANLNRISSAMYTGMFSEMTYNGTTAKGQDYYDLRERGDWAVDFENFGVVKGRGVWSTVPGDNNNYEFTNPTIYTNITDEWNQYDPSAKYCYCQITGFKMAGTQNFENVPSMFVYYMSGYNSSYYNCSDSCVQGIATSSAFREVLLTSYLAYCAANNIALDWYNDTVANNGTKITPNNDAANQCTYNETITVPTNEIQKPGYTFGGWKLRTTSND